MALFKVNRVVRLLCLKQIALVASWQGRPLMHYHAEEDVRHVDWGLQTFLTINISLLKYFRTTHLLGVQNWIKVKETLNL